MLRTSTTYIETEKRASQRIRVKVRAYYRSGLVSFDGWVANLSRCGLFLHTDLLDCAGTTAKLELLLPGMRRIDLGGEVIRVNLQPGVSGMGIRFYDLSRAKQRVLANFMIERNYQAPAGA